MNNSHSERNTKRIMSILTHIQKYKTLDDNKLRQILRKYPKSDKNLFSKDELISGYRELVKRGKIEKSSKLLAILRMKPTRTLSGVAVVTVMTKPFPCPGNCIFCPDIKGMPKSYIPSEPGAQRAVANKFHPYLQTYNRLKALYNTGHTIDKIELIVIGGTWSVYPEEYQKWFVYECFRALNEFEPKKDPLESDESEISWNQIESQHRTNEIAKCRCVGLSFETRPDYINEEEIVRMRRLGATKVQIGVQSLDNEILKKNNRTHTVTDTKRAFRLLRLAGFKIQAHWMINLFGSNPEKDIEDYEQLWHKDFCPDELKIYPTAIIESTELHRLYLEKKYKPYTHDEFVHVLKEIMSLTPPYCRISRVIRDIPDNEVVSGAKTNLRQTVEKELAEEEMPCRCIRCREIRKGKFEKRAIQLNKFEYKVNGGNEIFLSFDTKKDKKLVGFLRLFLPEKKESAHNFIEELKNTAIIREVHVYGETEGLSSKKQNTSQHKGVGRMLIDKAADIPKSQGLSSISVISAVGTRRYYGRLGFTLEGSYMGKQL